MENNENKVTTKINLKAYNLNTKKVEVIEATDFNQPGEPLKIANVFEDCDDTDGTPKTKNLETLTDVKAIIFVTMPKKLYRI